MTIEKSAHERINSRLIPAFSSITDSIDSSTYNNAQGSTVTDGQQTQGLQRKLTVGSLFAGIGGFDLGLERTGGFEIKWQVEIDGYCQRVLAKHWPNVKRYSDIRDVWDVEPVDVLCGGFPCQDISNAGGRAGIDGERSGLWSEFSRLIRMVRPRYVIVENVAALLGRGMERVLRNIAEGGLDAEWDVIPASAFGAPHIRERVWIVAYASGGRMESERIPAEGQIFMADTNRRRAPLADSYIFTAQRPPESRQECGPWAAEPNVGRVANGVSARVDRLKGLGNAVVPQIVTWIGNQILAFEAVEAVS